MAPADRRGFSFLLAGNANNKEQHTTAKNKGRAGEQQNTQGQGLSLQAKQKEQHTKYNLFIMCFYKEHMNKTGMYLYIILCYNIVAGIIPPYINTLFYFYRQ